MHVLWNGFCHIGSSYSYQMCNTTHWIRWDDICPERKPSLEPHLVCSSIPPPAIDRMKDFKLRTPIHSKIIVFDFTLTNCSFSLIGLCLSLCYSAIFVKTNRISRIFNCGVKAVTRPIYTSPISQIAICLGMLTQSRIWYSRKDWSPIESGDQSSFRICPLCASIWTFLTMFGRIRFLNGVGKVTFRAWKCYTIVFD